MGAEGILFPIPLLGLVDTGAPYTMVPVDLAQALGVRTARAPRVGIVVGGWRGKVPSVGGLTFRIRGPDVDAAGAEGAIEMATVALLAPDPFLLDFALLGQRGFLDRIDEFCVREKERLLEIRFESPDRSAGRPGAGVVRECSPRYRRGRHRR
ncbi:MAG: retroviral-like aspartic protease family protein [Planctomycetes bacterium]|nr:retroviral-like aspartic protease family protein [Planctomycetota bacterium]